MTAAQALAPREARMEPVPCTDRQTLPAVVEYAPETPLQRFKRDRVLAVLALVSDGLSQAKSIRAVAGQSRYPTGTAKLGKIVPVGTLKRWVLKWNKGEALEGRAGTVRYHVSRQWDAYGRAHGLSEQRMAEIGAWLDQQIRALWQQRVPSTRTIQHYILPLLTDRTLEAIGGTADRAEVRGACNPSERRIKMLRSTNRQIAIRDSDAGEWSGKYAPRIARSRRHLKPMDWIAGDVHHLDIQFRMPDGKIAHPHMVAWQDLATNRVFWTVHCLPPRRNVGQAEVLDSLLKMCADSDWGVPLHLYLDNGSEYRGLDQSEDLLALAALARGKTPQKMRIVQSCPYQPQGKIIEGLFSTLEGSHFAGLAGFVGGNRMDKITAELGQPPVPYEDGEEAFQAELRQVLIQHHGMPQQGHLDGRSPNEAYQAFLDNGWRAVILEPRDAAIAFAKADTRVVDRGVIRMKARRYYSDELLLMTGRTVKVRVPTDKSATHVWVHLEGKDWVSVPLEPTYRQGSGAGNAERQRRARRQEEMLDAHRVAPIDMREVRARAAAEVDTPRAPDVLAKIDVGYRAVEPSLPSPDRLRLSQDDFAVVGEPDGGAAANCCAGIDEAMRLFTEIYPFPLTPVNRALLVGRIEADGLRRDAIIELAGDLLKLGARS